MNGTSLLLVFVASVLLACSLLACAHSPSPIKGGASTQTAGAGFAPIVQELAQSQNPEQPSTQELHESRIESRPDGVVIRHERKAVTHLGGAQDQAGILTAWAKVKAVAEQRVRDILVGLALIIAAIVAWRRGNVLIASMLLLGALGSMFLHAGYGAASVGVACLIFLGYLKGQLP